MSKAIFERLRALLGGKLTQPQVNAANRVLNASGELLVTQMLGVCHPPPSY